MERLKKLWEVLSDDCINFEDEEDLKNELVGFEMYQDKELLISEKGEGKE